MSAEFTEADYLYQERKQLIELVRVLTDENKRLYEKLASENQAQFQIKNHVSLFNNHAENDNVNNDDLIGRIHVEDLSTQFSICQVDRSKDNCVSNTIRTSSDKKIVVEYYPIHQFNPQAIEQLLEVAKSFVPVFFHQWSSDKKRLITIHPELPRKLNPAFQTFAILNQFFLDINLFLFLIHQKGLVHGDLSPSSFVWEGPRAKVIEYFLVQSVQSVSNEEQLQKMYLDCFEFLKSLVYHFEPLLLELMKAFPSVCQTTFQSLLKLDLPLFPNETKLLMDNCRSCLSRLAEVHLNLSSGSMAGF